MQKRDRLRVRERKADHSTVYPLAPAGGEGIIQYLKNGRHQPAVQSRLLFWRHLAPQATADSRDSVAALHGVKAVSDLLRV